MGVVWHITCIGKDIGGGVYSVFLEAPIRRTVKNTYHCGLASSVEPLFGTPKICGMYLDTKHQCKT